MLSAVLVVTMFLLTPGYHLFPQSRNTVHADLSGDSGEHTVETTAGTENEKHPETAAQEPGIADSRLGLKEMSRTGQNEERSPERYQIDDFVPTYALGDQMMLINLGVIIPLFFALGPDGMTDTNLSLGVTGNLQWHSFLTPKVTLGGELGGMFAFSPSRTLYMVPITFRASYWFENYPFEFPVYLGVGINFSRLPDEAFKVDPIIKPGVSAFWNMNSEWAFGVNMVYWIVPQIYFEDDLADENRIGNFLDITLSALYRF
jgi:hypothetical protein